MTLELVRNKDRKFGADPEFLRLKLADGGFLLFTEEQVADAKARAEANPEDCLDVRDVVSNDFWRSILGL